MNFNAIEKLLSDNKRVTQWRASLTKGMQRAAAERDNDYYYLTALLQLCDYTTQDFYRFICPPGGAKAFAQTCLDNLAKQSSSVETEAIRLFNEAVETDNIGTKKDKKVKKDTE